MVSLLRGNTRDQAPYYAWYWSGNRAYRKGDWKAGWEKSTKKWELYNIAKDRTEMHNLAKSNPEFTSKLADAWKGWAKRTGLKVK